MQFFTRSVLTILITSIGSICVAQKIVRVEKSPIVCYARPENVPTKVSLPQSINNSNARVKTATITVDYVGFSTQARTAFQFAVDVWASLITSPVTIRVQANWTNLGAGVLGSAGPTFFASDFDGAPQMNVGYAGPLAEKLAGKNLNDPSEYDIVASFNSNFNWYYNSTGTPGSGQYDLISVVLHELGHGLGFVDSYNYSGGAGVYGSFNDGVPLSYDINIENQGAQNLYRSFTQSSGAMGTQLVSNNLFYRSPLILTNNSGQRAKIYAPFTWSSGSSIAHLDESTYINGNINSLMSPQFAAQEVIHDPGPITLSLFKDMGWSTIYIDHKPIASTEDLNASAFNVVAVVKGDNSSNYSLSTDQIYLNYYTSNNATVIPVQMTSTGNANEYSAQLPAPNGSAIEYFYYISAGDNLSRTITKPGKINTPLQSVKQGYYAFNVATDVTAPVVNHTPPSSISFQDEEVKIEAAITERYNLNSVILEYSLAGAAQPSAPMTFIDSMMNPITGLTTYYYETTVSTNSLSDGDEFAYRILAEDNSSNMNIGISPASDLHRLVFKGLKATQNSYSNNFNLVSDDFIGDPNQFSIRNVSNFVTPAIHSVHPYPEAGNGGSLDFIYTLRVPIKIKSSAIEAILKFDEIVLVEPGEPGSVFGTEEFYDYVVVEASKDGGATWTPLADGYDSRDYSLWLTVYNNSNSTAAGDASLFRNRQISLLNRFSPDDVIIIRFRLFSDPGANGWGWAIDNLKIQIDDEAPELLHKHFDFVKAGTTSLQLVSTITDNLKIESFTSELTINDQLADTHEELINATSAEITLNNEIIGLEDGDKILYKLSAKDAGGNISTLPASGYFEVPVVEFPIAADQYSNDFDSPSNDFIGNFFYITDAYVDFPGGAIHTEHDYFAGFGEGHNSDFTYTLKQPIKINANNPFIRFDEVVIVEGHSAGAVFGTAAFNDYVIVEGSKDGGATWKRFIDGYDSQENSVWLNIFNSPGADGTPAMYHTRLINMMENGNFVENDEVIIRFRLFSNGENVGWGWVIDNLYIQDAITGVSKELEATISVHPNPTNENITISAEKIDAPYYTIKLMNSQGVNVYSATEPVVDGKISHTISSGSLPAGMYMVKIGDGANSVIRKVVKTN